MYPECIRGTDRCSTRFSLLYIQLHVYFGWRTAERASEQLAGRTTRERTTVRPTVAREPVIRCTRTTCVYGLSSPAELARPDCEPPLQPLAKSPLHVSIFISHTSDHKRRTCRRRPSSQYHTRRGNARASDGVRGAAALAAAAVTVVATAAQTLRPRAPWSLGLSSWLVRMPSSLVRRLNSDKSSRSRYSSSLRRRVTIAVSPRSDE